MPSPYRRLADRPDNVYADPFVSLALADIKEMTRRERALIRCTMRLDLMGWPRFAGALYRTLRVLYG